MGFNYAGNLLGVGSPVVRKFLTAETMYVGQFVQGAVTGSAGGAVQLLDVATDAKEDDVFPIGIVSGVVDGSRTYVAAVSGTAGYGDRTTFTTTQSDVAANGPSEVEVTLAIPGVTLIRAPIYNTVWGTALYEIVNATADSTGLAVVSPVATADIADDLGTIYCRSGANRGIYRNITDISTVTTTVTVPFPYGIAAGDVFVQAAVTLGYGGFDPCTAADAIDGNNDMADYYSVYYHDINLEESGKEYATFALWGFQTIVGA
jgi:hypothetical protein